MSLPAPPTRVPRSAPRRRRLIELAMLDDQAEPPRLIPAPEEWDPWWDPAFWGFSSGGLSGYRAVIRALRTAEEGRTA